MEDQLIEGTSRLFDYGVLGIIVVIGVFFIWAVIVPLVNKVAKSTEIQAINETKQTELIRQITENLVKLSDNLVRLQIDIPQKIDQAKTEIIQAINQKK